MNICNVGKKESAARAAAGIVAAVLGYALNPWWYLLAAILLITAAMHYCPLKHAAGIKTCPSCSAPEKNETDE